MKINYVIPGIPPAVRYALFGLFVAGGVWYQFFVPDGNWLLGCLVILAGSPFVVARGFFNKPKDLGFEDWQPASRQEFDRINSNLGKTKKAKYPFYFKPQFGLAFAVLLGFIMFLILVISDEPDTSIILAVFDCMLIVIPVFASGGIRLWMPNDLRLKMERLSVVIKEAEKNGGSVVVTPYLRLDKDKAGRRIPEDVRLMLEPRRKREELVGVQVQVAVNNGPNGAVPYMYAVFLCKGKGKLFEKLKDMDYGDMVSEPGGDNEYGYVVIRQKTTGGGYHTDNADCVRLFGIVKETLASILKS